VQLTPGRSIAVDKIHVYGTPFFIEADLPIASDRPNTKFRRLMVAQDTGSAITGPARADLYWGAGDDAGRVAGRIRHQGRFVVLLPRELDLIEAGKAMPLPPAKPPIPDETVAKKTDGKTDPPGGGVKREQTEKAPPDKTSADKKTEDAKKPSANARQQAQPAAKSVAKPPRS